MHFTILVRWRLLEYVRFPSVICFSSYVFMFNVISADLQCLCTSQAFEDATRQCLQNSCPDDISAATSAQQSQCASSTFSILPQKYQLVLTIHPHSK